MASALTTRSASTALVQVSMVYKVAAKTVMLSSNVKSLVAVMVMNEVRGSRRREHRLCEMCLVFSAMMLYSGYKTAEKSK